VDLLEKLFSLDIKIMPGMTEMIETNRNRFLNMGLIFSNWVLWRFACQIVDSLLKSEFLSS
jgi:hypothetical protein